MKSSEQFAIEWNRSKRAINDLCNKGKIPGAIKEGRKWLIPDDAVRPVDKRVSSGKYAKKKAANNKPLPIGISDYVRAQADYYYVDKTLLIKEFLDQKPLVSLFTRPRRFGKTLTMSMTEQFFSLEYAGRSDLFENLKIWQDEKYRNLQGTYPVISLSFANIKEPTYELTQRKICDLIAQLYFKYDFITEGNALIREEVKLYKKIMNNMDYVDATLSLNYLSGFLYKYYGKKVIILLDEYDTPMQEAYVNGYWDEIVAFTRSVFST